MNIVIYPIIHYFRIHFSDFIDLRVPSQSGSYENDSSPSDQTRNLSTELNLNETFVGAQVQPFTPEDSQHKSNTSGISSTKRDTAPPQYESSHIISEIGTDQNILFEALRDTKSPMEIDKVHHENRQHNSNSQRGTAARIERVWAWNVSAEDTSTIGSRNSQCPSTIFEGSTTSECPFHSPGGPYGQPIPPIDEHFKVVSPTCVHCGSLRHSICPYVKGVENIFSCYAGHPPFQYGPEGCSACESTAVDSLESLATLLQSPCGSYESDILEMDLDTLLHGRMDGGALEERQ